MDIKREYSLRVSKDYNEVDGIDRLGHSIWFSHKDSDISESAYFVLGDKEPFVKAIFDVNHNNPSNKVPYYSIFKEALDYISKVFFQDKDVLVAFEGLPFSAKYALHNYAIAYITLYSWMELSKDFEAQNKKMWLDGIEYLDEVYINEFIDKILADETECVCDVNLYTIFHSKLTSKDLKPSDAAIVNNIIDEFIKAVNDTIFVSDEEMNELRDMHELTEALDSLTEGMSSGDVLVIKGKSDDDKEEPETPIN